MSINEFKPIVSPYFGEHGLTSVSANTIADRVKHLYESVESELNSTNFVKITFGLIGTPEGQFSVAKDAALECNFIDFNSKLNFIASCKAFIAFLREAIKAKRDLQNEVVFYIGKETADLKKPELEPTISEQDVINSMSVKDRERYLSLETKAAVYGKFIHPGNPLDKAIKNIESALADPRKIQYNGANTIIELKVPTVTINQANEVYVALQKEHRKAESELNGIKHLIEETIKEDEIRKRNEFNKALEEYHAKFQQLQLNDVKVIESRQKEIQNLKIVIPHEFEDLYNLVK